MNKGLFITFEGIDGAGKTLQSQILKTFFIEKGREVSLLREPGGTQIGESIRDILMSPSSEISPWSEVFLFLSARKALVDEKVNPTLSSGKVVILDRFFDSTYAYQGYGRGIDISYLKEIHRYAGIDLKPDVTFLLDISPSDAWKRLSKVRDKDNGFTRIERSSLSFFERVREGYLKLSKDEPDRIKVLDATQSICDIHKEIVNILKENGFI